MHKAFQFFFLMKKFKSNTKKKSQGKRVVRTELKKFSLPPPPPFFLINQFLLRLAESLTNIACPLNKELSHFIALNQS